MSTDQLPEMRPATAPRLSRFRHDAMLYQGHDQFVERTAGFVRDALAAEEAIMVAVIEPRASLLREELGADARLVNFIDMAAVGRNPARIIPAWQAWVIEHRGAGRGFRGIGEPIWSGRSPAELIECQQHEALLNTAFDEGPPWWLLCPYDTSVLDSDVIARAHQTHPGMMDEDRAYRSDTYPHPEFTRSAMFSAALSPEPAEPLYRIDFGLADLPRIRQAVASCAAAQRVAPRRVDDLVLVANELACNSIKHGGGTGTLRMWRDGGELVCEVRDRGLITDPLVGRRKPNPESEGGAGLWIANLLCDLVQIRSTPQSGTTVRVHMETSSADQRSDAESVPGDQSSKA
ncbi:MAG TPA: sensor histidine kinase [Actinocrinis sp.]|nr:sensor histidine kinase [Actinocrinis sp.]